MAEKRKVTLTNGAGFRNTVIPADQADALKRKLGFYVPPKKDQLDVIHKAHEAAEKQGEGK